MHGMDDLVAFLRARLDEDEAAAKAAGGEEWDYRDTWVWCGPFEVADIFGGAADVEEIGAHIGRHDPARVLREVAVKREIVDLHGRVHDCPVIVPASFRYVSTEHVDEESGPCTTLRQLAAIYSDHPDYRAEWKP